MSLVLIGLGKAYYKGELLEAKDALEKAGIEPIPALSSKEGLALTNGTQALTSTGAHVLYDAINLSKHLDIAASLTMEGLHGIIDAYDPRISEVRGHLGQINTAENMRKILAGSSNVTKQGVERVQDSYVLRCIPQIHGASKDTLEYVKQKVEIELNAATDNPLIFVDTDEVISGGNFHGQPMALPFDFLGIALAEMANVSERRIEKMVNPAINHGLPAFLVEQGGLNSGFMIVQYSAAALVSENKVLAHPASVDSIPTSANQEDHVSMGSIAAKKSKDILENVRKVIGMELITACQAIDLKGAKDKLSPATKVAYEEVRKLISYVSVDRPMYIDIHAAEDLIKTNTVVDNVEKAIGELKF